MNTERRVAKDDYKIFHRAWVDIWVSIKVKEWVDKAQAELGGTDLADSSRAPGRCLQSHRILIIQAISGK